MDFIKTLGKKSDLSHAQELKLKLGKSDWNPTVMWEGMLNHEFHEKKEIMPWQLASREKKKTPKGGKRKVVDKGFSFNHLKLIRTK